MPLALDASVNPNGILYQSPGLAYFAYLGCVMFDEFNPIGVVSWAVGVREWVRVRPNDQINRSGVVSCGAVWYHMGST